MEFYLMLIASSVLTATDVVLNKLYQMRNGASLYSGLFFNLLVGSFSAVIFFCVGGFRCSFTLFSGVAALVMTATAIAYVIIGFVILSKGQMTYYTFFRMSGSMLVPYFWGLLFLNETFLVSRAVGVAMILFAALLLHADKKAFRKGQILLCLAVFLLAGTVSVISKLHAISPSAVSPMDYVVLTSLVKPLLCGPILLALRKKESAEEKSHPPHRRICRQSVGLVLLSAAITGVAYILQLYSAASLPATAVYPIVTGGSIVFTMMAGWIFFHERPGTKMLVAAGLSFCGTCLFL